MRRSKTALNSDVTQEWSLDHAANHRRRSPPSKPDSGRARCKSSSLLSPCNSKTRKAHWTDLHSSIAVCAACQFAREAELMVSRGPMRLDACKTELPKNDTPEVESILSPTVMCCLRVVFSGLSGHLRKANDPRPIAHDSVSCLGS